MGVSDAERSAVVPDSMGDIADIASGTGRRKGHRSTESKPWRGWAGRSDGAALPPFGAAWA